MTVLPRSAPYLELTLDGWLDELAAATPVPGGGSALAFALASAASVLVMTARVSGESGHAAQADTLRARAAALVQLDAVAYASALAAKEVDPALPPKQRDWKVGQAFALAAEPPLAIARTAADVAELAAQLAVSGDPRLRADALTAAAVAVAAATGAAALVATNLTAVAGDPRVAEADRCVEAAEQALQRC
jgi:methenyltetrahydrofolate cyclohydrolase